MSFYVTYHPHVVRDDIPKLGAAERKRIKIAIEQKLATQPEIFGKPLRHSQKGYRKLRIGDHRVIFRIEKDEVKILFIGHRSVVYKLFDTREM